MSHALCGYKPSGPLSTIYHLLSTVNDKRYLVLVLLLAYFAQGMVHVRHASITFDEGPHLAVGYTTLRTGDFRFQPVHIHPPLANLLAATPLLLQHDLPHPTEVSGWEIASLSALTDEVVWQYPHPARIATVGRLPILWLGVLLGALIFRWAAASGQGGFNQRETQSHPTLKARLIAGLIALTLYAFDPNLIAHGSLITTDMAAVFFIVATLYIVTTWKPERLWMRDIGLGTLLGLAQLTKVSALMLVPVVGLILGFQNLGHLKTVGNPSQGHKMTVYAQRISHFIIQSVFILITAAFVIWAGYGFQWTQVSINTEALLQTTQRLKSLLRTADFSLKIPAGTHILIYQSLREHYELGHPTFLMGRVSTHGWWWYFPVAFALKTPLPTLILAAWAVVRSISKAGHRINVPFLLFPLLYTLSSLFSTVNIGYRHLLPLLPFLYIGIGRTLSHPHAKRFLPVITSLLLLWQAIGTLHIAPHYLTFFNEIAGGAKGGYRYLVDSNLDWGQNLWDLKRWLTQNKEGTTTKVVTTNSHGETTTNLESVSEGVITTNRPLYYAHYSPARPSSYGINADFLPPDPRAVPLTPWQPAPGRYAIGATVWQGPYAPDINTYAWFRTHTPTTRLGNALWVYDVPPCPSVTWAVVCTGVNLSSEALKANVGQPDLRIIHTDCAQTYIHPADPNPGLYIFAGVDQIFSLGDGLLTEPLELEVQLRDKQGNVTHTLYRVTDALADPMHPITHFTTTGPLDFLGYTLHRQTDETLEPVILSDAEGSLQPGDTLELQTTWRVTTSPRRPLSLMAHLAGPDGTTAAVGDGLGYPIEQWRPGDLIIQRHTLTVPVQAAPGSYTLLGGVYWLDNLKRWTFYDTSPPKKTKQDTIPLITLQIKKENVAKKFDF
jgi:hypothetical protein